MSIITAFTPSPALRFPHRPKAAAAAFVAILLTLLLVWAIAHMAWASKSHATAVSTTAIDHTAQAVSAPMNSAPAAIPVEEQSVVARVNGATLTRQALQRASAIDDAIASWLGQPITRDRQEQLEQLINGALVAQHAAAANYTVAPAAATEEVANWLAAVQRSPAALRSMLTAAHLADADFQERFAELMLIDRFLKETATQRGIDQTALLQQWRQTAQISYGPAANQFTSSPAAAPRTGETPSVAAAQAAPAPTVAKIGPFTLWQDDLTARMPPAVATIVTTTSSALATSTLRSAPPAAIWATTTTVTSTALTATAVVTAVTPPLPPVGLAPGNRAPAFSLARLADDSTVDLATWQGQPLVLSFWTTWCPYCRKQTPILVAAARETPRIQFVGVNVNESADPVTAYVAEQQIPYPILLDDSGAVATQYNVRGYPTTYFIDAAGQIVAKHVGALDADQLTRYLDQLLPSAAE